MDDRVITAKDLKGLFDPTSPASAGSIIARRDHATKEGCDEVNINDSVKMLANDVHYNII